MKKLFSFLCAFALFANSLVVIAQDTVGLQNEAPFPDVGGTYSYEAVKYLKDKGVVQGFQDGSYGPQKDITRAEFLKITLMAANLIEADCTDMSLSFPDVNQDDWFYDVVCSAVKLEIANGYPDGTFRPNDLINFAEASKLVANTEKVNLPELADDAEWFEKFTEAMRRDRVVPGSVGEDDNDKTMTRGEFAQMIWGVQTGMEVENPRLGVIPELDSCAELSAQAKKFQKRQQYQSFALDGDMMLRGEVAMEEAMPMDPATDDSGTGAPAPSVTTSAENKAADEFSTTNVQEFGVDEADIIKNDGSHIFLIKNNTIRIIAAYPPENLAPVATIALKDKNFWPQEMYLDGDTLTVIGNGGGYITYADEKLAASSRFAPDILPAGGNMVNVISFDISDRENPKIIREVSMDASYTNSRKIGDVVYLVANKYNNWYWGGPVPLLREADMPVFSDSARSEETIVAPCGDVRYFPNFQDPNYLIVAAIDTRDISQKVHREVLLGSGNEIYASPENMYVTRSAWDETYWEQGNRSGWSNREFTDFFKFALEGTNVDFVSKGRAEGRVLNQFSMSEYDDHFRVATQKGYAWGNEMSENLVTIFDSNMKETSRLTGIAPGEDIKSVRFMGKRGFVVTFKTVDPLFVIDMDPQNPKILGKLKIPGWSDYLHPYDENHLIGFGKEVDESIDADKVHSENAIYYTAVLGMKLSIFDVSDLENPKETHKEVIGYRGTNSEVLNNHKALLFDKEKGILAFPVTVTENMNGESGQDADIETVFSGAYVYDIVLVDGFTLRGKATNYDSKDWFEKSGEWFYGDFDRNIQRMIYIGDYFYSIAPNYIAALDWDDVSEVKKIMLDDKRCDQIYTGDECSSNSMCRTIWQVVSECSEADGETSCVDDEQFLRCEEK